MEEVDVKGAENRNVGSIDVIPSSSLFSVILSKLL
jgi:hypothetical protein